MVFLARFIIIISSLPSREQEPARKALSGSAQVHFAFTYFFACFFLDSVVGFTEFLSVASGHGGGKCCGSG
jgi:hypothetical protein